MYMILKRAQSDFADVVKTTILLKNIKDFQAVNEVYSQCFTTDMPARAAFEVLWYCSIFIVYNIDKRYF